ncbi:MAG: hypothetical protein AAB408_01005, partial [Patescibacteria group bacterium]
IFIHVTTLAPAIEAAIGSLPPGGSGYVRVPVSAGSVIGTKISDVQNRRFQVDFNVVDTDTTLTGFVVPEHYDGEVWKIHTVDPYEHFTPGLKAELEAKSNRSVPPIGGKIDYDIDGRLVGNWFLEGTGGYGGTNREKYWIGHLTIAYDYLDPKGLRISLGDWNGQAAQFGIKGNAPNPKDVTAASGMIKYELIEHPHYRTKDGGEWNERSFAKDLTLRTDEAAAGVVLLQLVSDRKLKIETFPNKTSSQVSGFTANARIFER